ncbi:hypothetical protein BDR03DRAFT_1015018 [Suillus americanus]|nr:hypothetical protein BDR03DRAFT_1015018 [Suillus americanus]
MAPTEAATSDIEPDIIVEGDEGDEEMDSDYLPGSEDEASDSESSDSESEIEDGPPRQDLEAIPFLPVPTDSPIMASGSSLITRSISTGLQFEFGPASLPAVLSYDDVMNGDHADLWRSIQFLYGQNKSLFEMYSMQSARLTAAEAHCTLASHQISMLNQWLANKTQKKRQKSKKINARFVMHPELREAFEAEEIERIEKEKVDAEKAAQKKAENDVRLSRIEEDIKMKVFDGSLSSYKRKDDLVTIAGALSLPRDGTMIELTAQIKEHLAGNPDCASQPRFAGLLGGKRTSAATVSAASTSRRSQNLPPELPTTPSSFQPGHLPVLPPPHFTQPSFHTGFNIPTPHPPYFFAQPSLSHGLHNPSVHQYPHPHTFPQQYFTPH